MYAVTFIFVLNSFRWGVYFEGVGDTPRLGCSTVSARNLQGLFVWGRGDVFLARELHRLVSFGKKTPDFNFILYDIIIYLTKSVIREIIRYTKNKGVKHD